MTTEFKIASFDLDGVQIARSRFVSALDFAGLKATYVEMRAEVKRQCGGSLLLYAYDRSIDAANPEMVVPFPDDFDEETLK